MADDQVEYKELQQDAALEMQWTYSGEKATQLGINDASGGALHDPERVANRLRVFQSEMPLVDNNPVCQVHDTNPIGSRLFKRIELILDGKPVVVCMSCLFHLIRFKRLVVVTGEAAANGAVADSNQPDISSIEVVWS